MLLGCIADDFTGATDLAWAEQWVKKGPFLVYSMAAAEQARLGAGRAGRTRRAATHSPRERDPRRVHASIVSAVFAHWAADRTWSALALYRNPGRRAAGAAHRLEVRQVRRGRLLHQSLRKAVIAEAWLRQQFCAASRSLFARGYVYATAGNISARLEDDCPIAPTGACQGQLDPATLAKVDVGGQPLGGSRPSMTLASHRRIHAADPQAHSVVHTHSTNLVAQTLQGVWSPKNIVPPITPYFVMKVGHVPLTPNSRPGDSAVGERVAGTISQLRERGLRLRAVMPARPGANVWDTDPACTMATLGELEAAKLRLACAGRRDPLDPAQIEELRRAFGASL